MKNQKNIIYAATIIIVIFLMRNITNNPLISIGKQPLQLTINKLKLNEEITITVNSFTHVEKSLPKQTLVIKRIESGFVADYYFSAKHLHTKMSADLINKFNKLDKQLNFTEDTPFTCTKSSEYIFASIYKNFKSRDTRYSFKAFDDFIKNLYN